MSTLEVSNLIFEETANNALTYSSNTLRVTAGGANTITINTTATSFINSAASVLYLSSNGKIGVGCTTPITMLTVSANTGTATSAFGGGNTILRLSGNTSAYSEPAIEFGERALSPTAKIASKNEQNGGGSLYFITRDTSATNSTLSTRLQINSLGDFDFNAGMLSNFQANIQIKTTSYTLTNSDSGSIIEINSASNLTVTLPNTAPVGFNITVTRIGAGNVTFSNAAGTTLRKTSTGANLTSQYSVGAAYVRVNAGAAADWVLSGDLL